MYRNASGFKSYADGFALAHAVVNSASRGGLRVKVAWLASNATSTLDNNNQIEFSRGGLRISPEDVLNLYRGMMAHAFHWDADDVITHERSSVLIIMGSKPTKASAPHTHRGGASGRARGAAGQQISRQCNEYRTRTRRSRQMAIGAQGWEVRM